MTPEEQEVKRLELALLSPATRADPAQVRLLLHEEFFEIGRSGRRWSRAEMIASLAQAQHDSTPATDGWLFTHPAPGPALVTYRICAAGADSWHTSLWDIASHPFRLRFHQGTVVPAADT